MKHKRLTLFITAFLFASLCGCATQNSERMLYGALNGAINGYAVRGTNTVANGALSGLVNNVNCYPVTALCNANLYRDIYK